MILVVGSTGSVGSIVTKSLAKSGKPVTAFVRDASSEKAKALSAAGAKLVTGDVKDRAAIKKALAGVKTVICTASSTMSRQEGDSIESVDKIGVGNLIDEALAAGVPNLIYVSYSRNILNDFPLSDAKRSNEKKLESSSANYTILLPSYFPETWLSPAVGFDAANGKVTVYGEGNAKVSYISVEDVAKAVLAAVDNAKVSRKAVPVGGAKAYSQLEAVQLVEKTTGKKLQVNHMTDEQLKGARAGTTDPLMASFLGLFASLSRGDDVSTAWTELLPVQPATLEQWVNTNFKR